MSERLFCGIDTSNYTTSVSIVTESGKLLLNRKKLLPVQEGARGLRQSDAVFHHVKQLPQLAVDLREAMEAAAVGGEIAAIGVSAAPRDADGSYMPCFLSGVSAAEIAGALLRAPVHHFSHQAGHVMAALFSSGMTEWMDKPFIAFHVSGGTTDILHVQPSGQTVFAVEKIGGTRDINAGQLIDRSGVAMGLRFPAGAEMERLAAVYGGRIPSVRLSVSGLECNLSGLENKALQLYESTRDTAAVSAFVLCSVGRTLAALRDNVRSAFGEIPILYAGGVMSCRRIQEMLRDENSAFSEPALSSDNAVGAALLARYRTLAG
ncbi:MAG: peptidase M22 [Clostridia bacterium]|nr:peptidase M22 [Clostridia bacterium]